jgi:hypothetical protein
MRSEISRTVAASAFASAVLLAQGCSRQVAIEEPRYMVWRNEMVSRNEPDKMVVCNDPGNTQCMVCDSITHQCHFPVFKLP